MRTGRLAFAIIGLAGCAAAARPPSHTGSRTRTDTQAAHAESPNATTSSAAEVPMRGAAPQGASIVTSHDGRVVIAFDEDNGTAVAIDSRTRATLSKRRIAKRPVAGVALSGGRIAVIDRDAGSVALYALGNKGVDDTPLATGRVADDPVAIAASPDERTLYVTSGATATLTALATDTLATEYMMKLPREPRAIAPSPDGHKLYVGHLVGGVVSVVDLHGRRVRTLSLPIAPERAALDRRGSDDERQAKSRTRNVAALARSLAMDPDGEKLYVAHVVEANGSELPLEGRGDGYGGLDPATIDAIRPVASVSVLDTRADAWVPAPASAPQWDESMRLPVFADPSAIAVRPSDHKLLLVSRGTRWLGVLAPGGSDPSLRALSLPLDVCEGASGVAVDADGHAWINCQFDHRVVAMSDEGRVAGAPIGDDPLPADVAQGRRLFFRADSDGISRFGFSCATCHPDGRDDGNVWSSENGMRQTISLAGRVEGTAPYNWNGHNPTLDLSVQQTVMRLSGLGLGRRDREMLEAYLLRGLQPPRAAPAHDDVAARGERVFGSAGCAGCHDPTRRFTDGQAHDVQSAAKDDRDPRFDTPSLFGVGATAPYFHDGRYDTLERLVADNHDRMGKTSDLSRDDTRALVAFLNGL